MNTRRGIYGKLAADTTLNALLHAAPTGYSKSIYYQVAPDEAQFPYVVFQKQAGTPVWALARIMFQNEVWLVKGVDRSTDSDPVEAIASRIDTLLNDASLSISGATGKYLRRESDVDYPEVTGGVRYLHSGATYRLVTEPS